MTCIIGKRVRPLPESDDEDEDDELSTKDLKPIRIRIDVSSNIVEMCIIDIRVLLITNKCYRKKYEKEK